MKMRWKSNVDYYRIKSNGTAKTHYRVRSSQQRDSAKEPGSICGGGSIKRKSKWSKCKGWVTLGENSPEHF